MYVLSSTQHQVLSANRSTLIHLSSSVRWLHRACLLSRTYTQSIVLCLAVHRSTNTPLPHPAQAPSRPASSLHGGAVCTTVQTAWRDAWRLWRTVNVTVSEATDLHACMHYRQSHASPTPLLSYIPYSHDCVCARACECTPELTLALSQFDCGKLTTPLDRHKYKR